VRSHAPREIILFEVVFECVYSPNVKESLAEAESVTLHTLRHGGFGSTVCSAESRTQYLPKSK
jgi:hypothetical protein